MSEWYKRLVALSMPRESSQLQEMTCPKPTLMISLTCQGLFVMIAVVKVKIKNKDFIRHFSIRNATSSDIII